MKNPRVIPPAAGPGCLRQRAEDLLASRVDAGEQRRFRPVPGQFLCDPLREGLVASREGGRMSVDG